MSFSENTQGNLESLILKKMLKSTDMWKDA